MAILRSIYQKDKEYIFKSFDNNKNENPAKVIFKRFPFSDESFPVANQKSILESPIAKGFDNSQKSREQLVEHIIGVMIDNISANRINFELFIRECIEGFEQLVYNDKEIKTVSDFLELPQSAIQKIALELYLYSRTEDEFTTEEKKI
ncbi:MAG: hypothetical protein FWD14_01935 [Treponema sp.]|nr:hypothetical protein [Treponema sp.]